jgi:hypothetical protein
MDTTVKTFKLGEAPWEKKTFPVGSAPWEAKRPSLSKIKSENRALQQESDYLNSARGIAAGTLSGTASSLFKGAITFVKSAVNAPVDIVRGAMGKDPMKDNTGIETIQSQAVGKTADVFEGTKTPIRATSELVGQTVGGAADILGAEGLIQPTRKIAGKIISSADKALEIGRKAKNLEKVTELISPNATAKEAKLALSEGRFVEGKPGGILKSGTPDKILPSEKTVSASQTIINKIPGAAKMSPAELFKAVDGNIIKTAEELKPVMKATPIKPETIQKINTDWEAVKQAQIAEAPATEELNVLKRQAKFEATLKKSGNASQNDLWETRIAYDNSIPDNVKRANILSPESLQIQKEEWLQNRAVLNDAMNDLANGMGETSRKAFKEMADLYNAKTGLLSKTKINAAELSKLRALIKQHPKMAAIIFGALGLEGAKILGIDVRNLLP